MHSSKTGLKNIWIPALFFGVVITLVSWASQESLSDGPPGEPFFRDQQQPADTVPPKRQKQISQQNEERENTIRSEDLDRAIEEVERAREIMEEQLQRQYWKRSQRDLERAQAELRRHHYEIKAQKMMQDEKMRDMEIMLEKQIHEQMEPYLREELSRAREEVRRSMEHGEFKHQLDHEMALLERNREKMKIDMGRMQTDMQKAREELARSGEELRTLKNLVSQLQQDGYIKKGKPYEVKIENQELYIDGKKQPANIRDKYRNSDKYKKLFEKGKNFNIISDGKEAKDWI